jgi:DNA ligase (NAD+)
MTRDEAQVKALELRKKINQANYQYYTLDSPLISDQDYDESMRELHDLETDWPELIAPDSPTQRVGSKPLDSFKKIKHAVPMLSLDNVFSIEELTAWAKKTGATVFCVQPKLDGLAIELVYEKGKLRHGATRGDKETGEDVTHNIKTIKEVPLSYDTDLEFRARGEVVIYKKDLETINEAREAEGKDTYVNPRNAAAGGVRNLDPREAAKRKLRFFAYDLLMDKQTLLTHQMKQDTLDALKIPTARTYLADSLEKLVEIVTMIEKDRANYPYDIDGAVIKVNNLAEQEKLGFTSRVPRWAIALKFKAEQAETVINSITVQVGRTGTLTPVAELKPVVVGQATISRATLHNQDMLIAKNLNVGDLVIIQRAGDVIPEVVKVSEKRSDGYFLMPDVCPACGEKVSRIDGEAAIRCTNAACIAKLTESLKHFVCRDALNIEGLGEKVIEQLVNKKLVKSPYDLFTLLPLHFAGLERMGDKLAAKMIAAIQKARTTTLDRFIYSLGIPMVGRSVSKQYAAKFGTMEAVMDADIKDILSLDGIGTAIAENTKSFFGQQVNRNLVNGLLHLMTFDTVAKAGITSDRLKGKVFVVTGNHSTPREDLKALIVQHGGKCVGSLSSKVNILLAGKESGPKKLAFARENKVLIWAEGDLMDAINATL